MKKTKKKPNTEDALAAAYPMLGYARTSRTVTLEKVVAAIGLPVKEWPGKCHEIAGLLLAAKLVEGRLRYGMYTGFIHPKAEVFGGRRMSHHGWIELDPPPEDDPLAVGICATCDHVEDEHETSGFFRPCLICPEGDCADYVRKRVELESGALVLDPTRWVFEKKQPYIFEGRDTEGWYDPAGDKLRQTFMRPYPNEPLMPGGLPEKDHRLGAPKDTLKFLIDTIAGYGGPRLEIQNYSITLPNRGLGWIANLPLSVLGAQATSVYDAIKRIGQTGFIPLDNLETVQGDGFYGQRAALEKIVKGVKKDRKSKKD